jgi:hypothetical protein
MATLEDELDKATELELLLRATLEDDATELELRNELDE